MFESGGISTEGKTPKECSTKNRQEVSDVHGHDTQHAARILEIEDTEAEPGKLTASIRHQRGQYP
jgi:hypothetical protein